MTDIRKPAVLPRGRMLSRMLSIVLAVMAALAAPFIVVGLSRLVHEALPTELGLPLPWIIIGVAGMATLAKRRLRPIGIGLLAGTAVFGLFFLVLIAYMSYGFYKGGFDD